MKTFHSFKKKSWAFTENDSKGWKITLRAYATKFNIMPIFQAEKTPLDSMNFDQFTDELISILFHTKKKAWMIHDGLRRDGGMENVRREWGHFMEHFKVITLPPGGRRQKSNGGALWNNGDVIIVMLLLQSLE